MLTVILPVGILLRIFPVFRGIGALFISIAIGFYFIFPIAYILLDPTTVRPDASSIVDAPSVELPDACFSSFSGYVSMITQTQVNQPSAYQQAGDPTAVGTELAKMQMETFFYPLTALASALLFIASATPLLGGDSGQILHFLSKVI
jgi:hypothetical protein